AFDVSRAMASIERWRLALVGDGPPMLTRAGEQFLTRRGFVTSDTLEFLASAIDDLNAREAFRRATIIIIAEFTDASAEGQLVEHARTLVPPAFERAVDARLAARLLAAASALAARLGRGEPAGCVAEEILAVQLIEIANELLVENEAQLGEDAAREAADKLRH